LAATLGQKSKILIVDDNAINHDILVAFLGEIYDLRTEIDGEIALALIAEGFLPDLILLDIMMPGMDGYEVCQRLQGDRATEDIPVIFLTSLDSAEDEARGLELGAVDYITKPFNPAIVKKRIHTHLQAKFKQDILHSKIQQKTKDLEKALAEANAKETYLQSIFKAAPVGIGLIIDRKLQWINLRMGEMVGYSSTELDNQSARILYQTQAEFEWVGKEKYRQISKFGTGSVDTQFLKKDGSLIDVILSSTPLAQNNLSAGVIFTALDITERKRIDEDRERLLQAIDQSSETIIITDQEGIIQYVNPVFEKITGYTCEEAIGQNPSILKSGKQDDTFYKQMWETLTCGSIWRGRLINKKKNGTFYIEDTIISPVYDSSGSIINFVAAKRDITEKKKLEEEASRASRLASVGELAAGVAHEINNPNALILYNSDILTAVIRDLLHFIAEKPPVDSEQLFGGLSYREVVQEVPILLPTIHDSAQRIKRIVKELRDFARQDNTDIGDAIEVNQVVQAAVHLVSIAIKKATDHFSLNLDESVPMVTGVAGRLEQVVINLLMNACQSLENFSQKISVVTTYDADTEQVQIIVTDEGKGMTADVMEHILEPFVTSKLEQGGTGLGLSVSARIIKEHQGTLRFKSTSGEGTIAMISLPVHKEGNHAG